MRISQPTDRFIAHSLGGLNVKQVGWHLFCLLFGKPGTLRLTHKDSVAGTRISSRFKNYLGWCLWLRRSLYRSWYSHRYNLTDQYLDCSEELCNPGLFESQDIINTPASYYDGQVWE